MQRPQFSLFTSHIDLAHNYWKNLLLPNDLVIDATCGNGHDTVFLAKILLGSGKITAIDKQTTAIEATKRHLATIFDEETLKNIEFFHQCHSSFPAHLKKESIKLIVYNLGYLPSGDKSVITLAESTLKSLHAALGLVSYGGAISITCYPGHSGGDEEEKGVIEFCAGLNPFEWSCFSHVKLNGYKSPSLILIQKHK